MKIGVRDCVTVSTCRTIGEGEGITWKSQIGIDDSACVSKVFKIGLGN